MNTLFNSVLFEKNMPFNQANSTSFPQKRVPFSDVTLQMSNFFNIKKNQQINIIPKSFNDFSKDKEVFTFLRKKSHAENIPNIESDEECKDQNDIINKPKKYSNNCYKMKNSLINNINEDEEELDKENFYNNNDNINDIKDKELSFNQILNNAIKEKKEYDKIERDKKKANKLKQLKMLIKQRKNGFGCTNNNILYSDKENVNSNIPIFYLAGKDEKASISELNMMHLD